MPTMTKNSNTSLHLIAGLLDFPEAGYTDKVNELQFLLDRRYPEAGVVFKPFGEFVKQVSLEDIQELHTRSFEVQAITTLDLGYLLFGDDYKRAELLVNLSREHTAVGNDCGYELADHLPNVIRLTSMLTDDELKLELLRKLIHPALKKMIGEFDPENLKKKNEVYVRHHKTLIDLAEHSGTIYQRPLIVLLSIIEQDFELGTIEKEKTSDFLTSLSTEMKIED